MSPGRRLTRWLADIGIERQRRRDLRRLLDTGHHLLIDIGIEPADAYGETIKSPWRR
ncbi:hypothetical protein [Arboricoccus pini]|uniref:hypothetical protein n=1 Tax=Arboricoccus pini TaxID=1963835 RepID=UPI0013FDC153|nr:hypothetical protein [Arboricoccus pini]